MIPKSPAVALGCLALAAINASLFFVEIPNYVQSTSMAVICLYVGTHLAAFHIDGGHAEVDRISTKEAKMFPIVGSVFLFGLYLAFKFLPKEWLLLVAAGWFTLLGVSAGVRTLELFVATLVGGESATYKSVARELFTVHFPKPVASLLEAEQVSFTPLRFVALAVAAFFGFHQYQTQWWLSNNFFALSFGIQGLSMIDIGSFFNAAVMLVGLFFYDIFWVFGTDVMVTVAVNFKAPIALQLPRTPAHEKFSMLGLGDIVMPGLLVGLMLRLDRQHKFSSSPYFWTCMAAYVAGLAVTNYVMIVWEHAQPALLYLVPACLLAVMGLAVVRGEFAMLWGFDTAPEEEEEEEAEAEAEGETQGEESEQPDGGDKAAETAAKAVASDSDDEAGWDGAPSQGAATRRRRRA